MFFEKDLLSFNILDVLELKQHDVNMFNSGRNFNALSFRFHSDAVLTTKTERYSIKDNYVSYFPARLDYTRPENWQAHTEIKTTGLTGGLDFCR